MEDESRYEDGERQSPLSRTGLPVWGCPVPLNLSHSKTLGMIQQPTIGVADPRPGHIGVHGHISVATPRADVREPVWSNRRGARCGRRQPVASRPVSIEIRHRDPPALRIAVGALLDPQEPAVEPFGSRPTLAVSYDDLIALIADDPDRRDDSGRTGSPDLIESAGGLGLEELVDGDRLLPDRVPANPSAPSWADDVCRGRKALNCLGPLNTGG